MDEIEIATGFELSDYMFVEIPAHKIRSIFMTYAYDGPRWYSKSECQFLLECGIASWPDFLFRFQATSHRLASDLSQKLKFMKSMWEDVGNTHTAENWSGERKKTRDNY